MQDRATRYYAVVCGSVIGLAILLCLLIGAAHAEHKPEHMMLHEQFYSTWMMPDNRAVSCCHNEDCEPAEAYEKDGVWYARKESEAKDFPEYIKIPANKVEHDRDSPDGRSHICGRRYSGFSGAGMTVFCFVPGVGG